MKIKLIIILLTISCCSFAQNSNLSNYKYIIVPNRYDFLKDDDQYRLNSLTKFLFEKENYIVYFQNDKYPLDLYNDPCLGLKMDLIKKSNLINTRVIIELKNCNNELVFASPKGTSRLKDLKRAYHEALRDAFIAISSVPYEYNGTKTTKKETSNIVNNNPPAPEPQVVVQEKDVNSSNALQVEINADGFVVLNKDSSVKYTALRTDKKEVFLLKNSKGILFKREGKWFVNIYDGSNLISKELQLKF